MVVVEVVGVVVVVVVVVVMGGPLLRCLWVMSNTHEQLLIFIAFSICAVDHDDYDDDDDLPPEFSRFIDCQKSNKFLQQVVQVSLINTN